MNGRVFKWILLTTVLLAAILVPFALFGDAIDTWVNAFIERSRNRPLAASLVLGGLLAGDILLPTPSSILSTACGALLGLPLGTAVSLAGMTLSAVAGYGVGRLGQRQVIERWIGAESAARLQRVASRCGAWTVVITRPVPILARPQRSLQDWPATLSPLSWGCRCWPISESPPCMPPSAPGPPRPRACCGLSWPPWRCPERLCSSPVL